MANAIHANHVRFLALFIFFILATPNGARRGQTYPRPGTAGLGTVWHRKRFLQHLSILFSIFTYLLSSSLSRFGSAAIRHSMLPNSPRQMTPCQQQPIIPGVFDQSAAENLGTCGGGWCCQQSSRSSERGGPSCASAAILSLGFGLSFGPM